METMDIIRRAGVVPVVVIDDAENAIPTATALLAGGIGVMEITMRTAAGMESIRRVSRECRDMLVGAGTVTSLEQCKLCLEAGARFIVSPGFDEEIVEFCASKGVCALPGCVTPSDIMRAMKSGVKTVKFFPADVCGGIAAMKAMSAPFGGVAFVPTGGVNEANLAEYIKQPFILAVGGSWLCRKADVSARDFQTITEAAHRARRIVDDVRGEEK